MSNAIVQSKFALLPCILVFSWVIIIVQNIEGFKFHDLCVDMVRPGVLLVEDDILHNHTSFDNMDKLKLGVPFKSLDKRSMF